MFCIKDRIEYCPQASVSIDLLRKTTGSIVLTAIDRGIAIEAQMSPFDNFIEIIEGLAEIKMPENVVHIQSGQAIAISAHHIYSIIAIEKVKYLLTIIKSGYEDDF